MTTKNLITLAVIAAGLLAADQPEYPAGHTLHNVPDDAANKLIEQGLAKEVEGPADSAPAPTKKGAKAVRGRVLSDCALGKVNAVVELPADIARQHEKEGVLDTNAAAVAYALTLQG